MAYDKIVDSAALDSALGGIADAIRAQTGGEEPLALEEMAAAISGIKNADDYLADVIDKRATAIINDKIVGKLPSGFQDSNKNLVTVDLPNVTALGSLVFNRCENLTTVILSSATTMDASCFAVTKSLRRILLNVETITGYGYSFQGSAIEKAVFPALRGTIRGFDFNGCANMVALVLGADTVCPMENTNALGNTPIAKSTGYIYVRASILSAYQAASNWSVYAAQFRAIEDYPGIMEV